MGSFIQYLIEQQHRNDPVGELARVVQVISLERLSTLHPLEYTTIPELSWYEDALGLAYEEFRNCDGWTRLDTLKDLEQDERLNHIIGLEPQIKRILLSAAGELPRQGYSQSVAYSEYKQSLSQLVGWSASNEQLRNDRDYGYILNKLSWVLPPDHSDLYPSGLPEFVHLDL